MTDQNPAIVIRAATPEDAGAVSRIYNHYVARTVVTFEEAAVCTTDMGGRIAAVQSESLPWLVAESGGRVRGFAYASRWQPRSAYRRSVECSVYLHPEWMGRGWGSRLYGQLLAEIRVQDVHAIIAGIALPNDASVAMHERLGFRKVAHFSEVGFKFDRWVDVGYWELLR